MPVRLAADASTRASLSHSATTLAGVSARPGRWFARAIEPVPMMATPIEFTRTYCTHLRSSGHRALRPTFHPEPYPAKDLWTGSGTAPLPEILRRVRLRMTVVLVLLRCGEQDMFGRLLIFFIVLSSVAATSRAADLTR